ncbi:MAG: tRNA (adenosine(37)-N6)-threonylcarbamoyltransferase complex ATPase subunit type 1 TsaE [Phycisphaerales bacterium]
MRIERITHGEGETEALGEALARGLRGGDVILLIGEMGAGKTRFVRGLARGLGHDPRKVHSPTFVLANVYGVDADEDGEGGGASGARMELRHVDAYRLEEAEEAEGLGWDRLADDRGVLVIEWGERVGEERAGLARALRVTMTHVGEQERGVVMEGDEAVWGERVRGAPGLAAARNGASGHAAAGGVMVRGRRMLCRVCGEGATEEFAPFCSERCRLVDLGKWFDGKYRVSREVEEGDEEVM